MAERTGGEKRGHRKTGAKLARTEPVSIRLDPKMRYLTELAARVHRRTVSSFIEWLLIEGLHHIEMRKRVIRDSNRKNSPAYFSDTNHMPLPLAPEETEVVSVSLMDEADRLWEPEEADRFVRLALLYKELLNYDETILWSIIRECTAVWHLHVRDKEHWTLYPSLDTINYQVLRKYWERFKQVAAGKADTSSLPRKEIEIDKHGIINQKIVDPLENNGDRQDHNPSIPESAVEKITS